VAATLARAFGHDDAWGAQIGGAAPIILLEDMTHEQALAVSAALADVEQAGSRFEIQPDSDPDMIKSEIYALRFDGSNWADAGIDSSSGSGVLGPGG
jgi:hypothetical protein